MKNNYFLTIAIPTYNRAELLKNTLDYVLKQRTEDVEILVCDNASTDTTNEMMMEYVRNDSVHYVRSETNGGMDANFLRCMAHAKGKYVHLLSDDDVILPGAIEKIREIIEQEEPDYIHLNSFHYQSDHLFHENWKGKARIRLKEDLVTDDRETYMDLIGIYVTFLSSTVIKRDNFLKIHNPKKFYGTYFMHAHIVLTTLRAGGKVVITRQPYIAAKADNSGGYNLYEVWVKQYRRLLLVTGVQSGFKEAYMKKRFIHDMNHEIKAFIVEFRTGKNEFDLKNRIILVQQTYKYPSVCLKTYPMAFLPVTVLKMVKNWENM